MPIKKQLSRKSPKASSSKRRSSSPKHQKKSSIRRQKGGDEQLCNACHLENDNCGKDNAQMELCILDLLEKDDRVRQFSLEMLEYALNNDNEELAYDIVHHHDFVATSEHLDRLIYFQKTKLAEQLIINARFVPTNENISNAIEHSPELVGTMFNLPWFKPSQAILEEAFLNASNPLMAMYVLENTNFIPTQKHLSEMIQNKNEEIAIGIVNHPKLMVSHTELDAFNKSAVSQQMNALSKSIENLMKYKNKEILAVDLYRAANKPVPSVVPNAIPCSDIHIGSDGAYDVYNRRITTFSHKTPAGQYISQQCGTQSYTAPKIDSSLQQGGKKKKASRSKSPQKRKSSKKNHRKRS